MTPSLVVGVEVRVEGGAVEGGARGVAAVQRGVRDGRHGGVEQRVRPRVAGEASVD